MIILGIETSCDETAAAIVKDGREVLAQTIESQIDIHEQYGGVVPEIASRSHLEALIPVVETALHQSHLVQSDKASLISDAAVWELIDAIAVTQGPGLSGSLLIGTLTARTLAWVHEKPIYGVNHVLAHTYANWLSDTQPQFPVLSLTASGGHTQLLLLESHDKYRLIGQTRDDAVGEAFDKVAKMLGLPYPGGPGISKMAQLGDSRKYHLPIARLDSVYDFSFSGLKTAVLRTLQAEAGQDNSFPSSQLAGKLSEQQKADMAASFQSIAVQTLVDKLVLACKNFQPQTVVVGGGVAANLELRNRLTEQALPNLRFIPPKLCTDNAAMIAALAYHQQANITPPGLNELLVQPSLTI